jgi:aspartyl-tRNA(Asn)/glutamyl-tRNA(Gln) amidotransferase subunit B
MPAGGGVERGMEFEPVIGLEVHAQLLTASKIFCGCSTRFGAEPNTQTCPVCTGMPGVLPVLNARAVEFAVRMGLATGCRIQTPSRFARKNYFYPDLPKGYQISQYEEPICAAGELRIDVDGAERRIRIQRIHLEEDAGKTIHDRDPEASLVDLNRAGTPLIEIVSEPDLRRPAEAPAYLEKLRQILVYLEICDGNMEEGSLRCDANISLRRRGDTAFGAKTEIKNLNSFKGVEAALEFEIERHREILGAGGRVAQETRLWDPGRGETRLMRSKEDSPDYRYFPEPDLLPIVLDPSWIEQVRRVLPELPDAKRERFQSQYGLGAYDAAVLSATRSLADYYERGAAAGGDPKRIANWVQTELLGQLNARGLGIDASPISPESISELVRLIEAGTISGKMAKEVFAEMATSGESPARIVERRGMRQIADASALEPLVREVIAAHPQEVEKFRAGKTKLLGFFVGEVMRTTRGQANPAELERLLRRELEGPA